MKITIEPENEKEEQELEGKTVKWEKVFEFAITGGHIHEGMFERSFSHLHVSDKFVLIGKLFENIERLRNG